MKNSFNAIYSLGLVDVICNVDINDEELKEHIEDWCGKYKTDLQMCLEHAEDLYNDMIEMSFKDKIYPKLIEKNKEEFLKWAKEVINEM